MYNISNTPKEHILDTIEAVKISKAIQKLDIKRYYENTKYPKASFKIWDELDYMDPSEMLAENMESRRLEYAKICSANRTSGAHSLAETVYGKRGNRIMPI